MAVYTNRYGDIFSFQLQEDNSIMWKGNFEYCRLGSPNDYRLAYQNYCKDSSELGIRPIHISTFKEKVHEYSTETSSYTPLAKRYGPMVKSITNKINMVDPSGGPYITLGMQMSQIDESFAGLIVQSIDSVEDGFMINTVHEFDHLKDWTDILEERKLNKTPWWKKMSDES